MCHLSTILVANPTGNACLTFPERSLMRSKLRKLMHLLGYTRLTRTTGRSRVRDGATLPSGAFLRKSQSPTAAVRTGAPKRDSEASRSLKVGSTSQQHHEMILLPPRNFDLAIRVADNKQTRRLPSPDTPRRPVIRTFVDLTGANPERRPLAVLFVAAVGILRSAAQMVCAYGDPLFFLYA
jgi:hypothetical protein